MNTFLRRAFSAKTALPTILPVLLSLAAAAVWVAFGPGSFVVRLTVAGVIAALVFFILRSAMAPESKLLQPEQFDLVNRVPSGLVGRGQDIDSLIKNCARNVLVFLIGDSGTGKSALVHAGLLPALTANGPSSAEGMGFVPLIIDLSAIPWRSGLGQALARKLCRLTQCDLDALRARTPEREFDVWSWLNALPTQSPKRLLVVLDQFDDYMLAHRDRFFVGTTVRSPSDIV
jgi:hypothetical protein